jgi:hypothetical protein
VLTVLLMLGSVTGTAVRDVAIALLLGWTWRALSRRRVPALGL